MKARAYSLVLLAAGLLPGLALAGNRATPEGVNASLEASGGSFDTGLTLGGLLGGIINGVLGLLGVIFLGLIIWSGAQWMTSQGNDEQVKQARDRLVNATIGIVIIALAFAITNYVVPLILRLTAT